jgi:hypothetical protein
MGTHTSPCAAAETALEGQETALFSTPVPISRGLDLRSGPLTR